MHSQNEMKYKITSRKEEKKIKSIEYKTDMIKIYNNSKNDNKHNNNTNE